MTARHLGILGGMGPAATSHFYTTLIKQAQATHGAKRDEDFPPFTIVSAMIPGFTAEGFTDVGASLEELIRAARSLESAGASLIAMPCNTAHALYGDIQAAISIPILHMPQIVEEAVLTQGLKKIALFGTRGTVADDVYAHPSLTYVPLEEVEQRAVIALIERGEEGLHDGNDTEALRELARVLSERGAEGIILGCTELSSITRPDSTIPFFDSSELLAKTALAHCYA